MPGLKKPIKLFGNEYREENVRFIHVDGLGYWFLYRKARLIGERDALRDASKKSQTALWKRTALISRIVLENETALKDELYASNPNQLSTKELEETKHDEKALTLALEDLIRSRLSNRDLLYHPVISKYRDDFTEMFMEDDTEYSSKVVTTAFTYRLIINDAQVKVNANDNEKGTLSAEDVFTGTVAIGQKTTADDQRLLDEALISKIFDYCVGEFNGETYYTTKELEDNQVKLGELQIPDPTYDVEEKKPTDTLVVLTS